MRARILPKSEWHRLEVTGLMPIFPDFRDEDLMPIVVEEDGEILATGTVVRVVHFESLWIKPGSHAGVARSLIRMLWSVGKAWGKLAVTQSCRPNVLSILRRLKGKQLEVDTFIIPLPEVS